jgi:transposase-like protein
MVVMAGDHKIHMEDVLQTDAALRVEIQTKDSCIEAQAIELARLRALIDEVTTSRAQTASLATEIRHENARLKKENQMLEEATLALRA